MANKQHLERLRQGVDAWNRWRQQHPDISPDLSEADLSGLDLSRANLIRANLIRANLSEANLGGSLLGGAVLHSVDFSGSNLEGANLTEANLRRANLRQANLSHADLSEANLTGAELERADLTEAILSHDSGAEVELGGPTLVVQKPDFPPVLTAPPPKETLGQEFLPEPIDLGPASKQPPEPDESEPSSAAGRSRAIGPRQVTFREVRIKHVAYIVAPVVLLGIAALLFRGGEVPMNSSDDEPAAEQASSSPTQQPDAGASSSEMIQALSAIIGGHWDVQSIHTQDGVVTAQLNLNQIPVDDYYEMMAAVCAGIEDVDNGSKPMKELRILDRFEQEGWVYRSPQRCHDIRHASPILAKLLIAANTTRFSPSEGLPGEADSTKR